MNQFGKKVDSTYLSLETATERGFIHRDYVAHCLRWSHVIKRLSEKKTYETARILDVGCGRELPLPTTLYSSRFNVLQYTGVDVGPINDDALARFHTGKFPITAFERTDILDVTVTDLAGYHATHVTCFEVLEHVEPVHMLRMLDHIKTLLRPDGTAWFSTPCWDVVSCAANHVNEMKFYALARVFLDGGWNIKAVHGTFASIKDYYNAMDTNHQKVFDQLRSYYDVNMLACIFAPLYPELSRNALWELTPTRDHTVPESCISIPNDWGVIPTPWGSSTLWKEMRR